MKLSFIFTVLNQLKIDHWQTKSHAEHSAFSDAYGSFDGLFDKFVEVFYGKYSIPSDSNTEYTIKLDSYQGNPINRYKQMRDAVVGYLTELTQKDNDLRNIKDEIEGEFNHLLYKLQQA